MIEGLILAAVIILSIQIWLYAKSKNIQYVPQRYDREPLLPRLHGKTVGQESYGTLLLTSGYELECSITETALIQVLKVFGVASITLGQGTDRIEEFFLGTFEIRHLEGLHPFGPYIGAIWPESAPSFEDEKSQVNGNFYLSARAFDFLLAAVGKGEEGGSNSAGAERGVVSLHISGPICRVEPPSFQKFENAFMVTSIDEVRSNAGVFSFRLEAKIRQTIDAEERKRLSDILVWLTRPRSQWHNETRHAR